MVPRPARSRSESSQAEAMMSRDGVRLKYFCASEIFLCVNLTWYVCELSQYVATSSRYLLYYILAEIAHAQTFCNNLKTPEIILRSVKKFVLLEACWPSWHGVPGRITVAPPHDYLIREPLLHSTSRTEINKGVMLVVTTVALRCAAGRDTHGISRQIWQIISRHFALLIVMKYIIKHFHTIKSLEKLCFQILCAALAHTVQCCGAIFFLGLFWGQDTLRRLRN